MKGAFWPMLRKDFRQALPAAAGIIAAVMAWQMFLYTRIGRWPMDVVLIVSALPFGFVPLWVLSRGLSTLRQEWAGNHMYLLLSLPIPGWYIAGAKVLVVTVEGLAYGVVIGAGWLLLARGSGGLELVALEAVRLPWGAIILLGGLSLTSPLATAVVAQFSYVASRLAPRLRGLALAVLLPLSGWFVTRAGTVLALPFLWLPHIDFTVHAVVDGVTVRSGMALDVAPVIGSLLAVAALFWATATLLERDVEL